MITWTWKVETHDGVATFRELGEVSVDEDELDMANDRAIGQIIEPIKIAREKAQDIFGEGIPLVLTIKQVTGETKHNWRNEP